MDIYLWKPSRPFVFDVTMADNIKYSKHKEIQGKNYQHYDNYDANTNSIF